jgi:hypothetical protein
MASAKLQELVNLVVRITLPNIKANTPCTQILDLSELHGSDTCSLGKCRHQFGKTRFSKT